MDPVGLLEELVSIRSVFPGEMEIGKYLEGRLKDIGFSVDRQPVSGAPAGKERFNLLASRGGSGKTIAFYGHMDTVPPYGEWKNDPFELKKDGDRLRGLGAWDMKAGIAAILMACGEAGRDRSVKILFGADEEDISRGAWTAARSGFLSGVDGVIVTEAGNAAGEHPGPRMITLGRRGRAVYTIEVPGVSAHGADMAKGLNAIDQASAIVRELSKMKMRKHPLLPSPNQFVRSFHAGTESLSIPDHAVIELDRHLVPPETPQSVLGELDDFVSGLYDKRVLSAAGGRAKVRLNKRETPYLAPYLTDKKALSVKRLESAVENVVGSKAIENYGLSVADENVFSSLGLPVATIGPAGGNDHSAEEWVSESSYLQLIDVLKDFLS